MDEWIDLSDDDLVKLETEIHSHLNQALNRGEQQQKAAVPPMPGPPPSAGLPETPSLPPKPTAEEQAATEEKRELERRENPQPPPRRLRARLREVGNKLRAKL